MSEFSPGGLHWGRYAPFTRIEDSGGYWDDLTSGELVRMYEEDLADDGERLDSFQSSQILNLVETRSELDRVLAGLPGAEVVAPRVHSFLRTRLRTPAKVLEAEEAVELTRTHLQSFDIALAEVGDMQLRPEIMDRAEWYASVIQGFDVRWVSAEEATPEASLFDGTRALGPKCAPGLVVAVDDFVKLSDASHALFGGFFDAFKSEHPSWSRGIYRLEKLVDFAYPSLVAYLVAPVTQSERSSESYYRLWEGGASLWIGKDGIEVRTDWAERWSGRYQD